MNTKIPFLNLKAAYEEIEDVLRPAVEKSMASGAYILGQEVSEFESDWADYCGAKHSIGVGSGLDAIEIALRASGISEGDEVAVPTNTFIATWLAVARVGATPVPIEPDPETLNISAVNLERAISPRMRAAIIVHLYGLPADLDSLASVAKRHDLILIEDAAQAHGARFRGKRIGSHGNTAAWSFYPGKNLGAFGDAGAITTNDDNVADAARLLRNYGSPEKYTHTTKGLNSRLDPVQAAVLSEKLRRLEEWNARRSTIANKYLEAMSPYLSSQRAMSEDDGKTFRLLSLPKVPAFASPSWHLFVVQVDRRDRFQEVLMSDYGIETLVHYPLPVHRQLAFKEFQDLPNGVADEVAGNCVSLPIGPHLTGPDSDYVRDSVVGILRGS